jgi:hypothetical protein
MSNLRIYTFKGGEQIGSVVRCPAARTQRLPMKSRAVGKTTSRECVHCTTPYHVHVVQLVHPPQLAWSKKVAPPYWQRWLFQLRGGRPRPLGFVQAPTLPFHVPSTHTQFFQHPYVWLLVRVLVLVLVQVLVLVLVLEPGLKQLNALPQMWPLQQAQRPQMHRDGLQLGRYPQASAFSGVRQSSWLMHRDGLQLGRYPQASAFSGVRQSSW